MHRRKALLIGAAAAAGTAWALQRWLKDKTEIGDALEFGAPDAMAGPPVKRGLSPAGIRPLRERLVPLFSKKRPPRVGEWLDKHEEAGETFEQHLAARRLRVCDQYATMYVMPLGEFTPEQAAVVAKTTDFIGRFFDMPAKSLPAVSLNGLPKYARREHPQWKIPQVLSTYLLTEVLEPRRPRDAVSLLALSASDLWPGEDWNFVFGQAMPAARVGVWSIYRNGDPEDSGGERVRFLRRTLKTAVHETGHMLRFPHCIAYECGMNGANHLDESDSQPLEFCPECQAKLWWTCGADPLRRTDALVDFAHQHALQSELPLWRAIASRLRP